MRKYIVQSNRVSAAGILHMQLVPKRPKDVLPFQAGQYAAISYRRNGFSSPVRCFSIVSSPKNTGKLDFAIRVQGSFTQSLADLDEGCEIKVRGPFGDFVVDSHHDRNIVMIAGGIGITPFMSMVRTLAAQGSPNRFTLLYSSNSQNNLPFHDELVAQDRDNPRFQCAFFITQGAVDKLMGERVVRGRVGAEHLQQLTGGQFDNCTYFICGPQEFIKSYRHILRKHKVPNDKIVTEEFAPKDRASRLTYAMTAYSLLLAVGLIGTLDLVRYMPKYARAQSAQLSSAPSATTQTQTSSTASAPAPPATYSQTPAPPPTPTVAPTQPTYQPTYQPSYQPPVSSVS